MFTTSSNIYSDYTEDAWQQTKIPVVSIEHMLQHMLPQGVSTTDMDDIKSVCRRKLLKNGRIRHFPLDPSALDLGVYDIFSELIDIFTAIKKEIPLDDTDIMYNELKATSDSLDAEERSICDAACFEVFARYNNDIGINSVKSRHVFYVLGLTITTERSKAYRRSVFSFL